MYYYILLSYTLCIQREYSNIVQIKTACFVLISYGEISGTRLIVLDLCSSYLGKMYTWSISGQKDKTGDEQERVNNTPGM